MPSALAGRKSRKGIMQEMKMPLTTVPCAAYWSNPGKLEVIKVEPYVYQAVLK
jgi:hypothetical protein